MSFFGERYHDLKDLFFVAARTHVEANFGVEAVFAAHGVDRRA